MKDASQRGSSRSCSRFIVGGIVAVSGVAFFLSRTLVSRPVPPRPTASTAPNNDARPLRARAERAREPGMTDAQLRDKISAQLRARSRCRCHGRRRADPHSRHQACAVAVPPFTRAPLTSLAVRWQQSGQTSSASKDA